MKQRLTASLLMAACLFIVACKRGGPTRASVLNDLASAKTRTVPEDGQLSNISEAVRNEYGLRATWEVRTGFDPQTYLRWLKGQLSEYRVISEVASSKLTMAKRLAGDSYTIEVTLQPAPPGTVGQIVFIAGAD